MLVGKTLFAQLMDFLPWTSFQRIVDRYRGDHRSRVLSCAEQFRVMAFAQLTFRESLRDIEVCLAAQSTKLYDMGLREPIKRSTLADANEGRDWRIYADFAQVLIRQARKLYADEPMAVDLDASVYALDSTTIDLRGNIPSFIEITDGKVHDVNLLDLLIPQAGAYYVMDRGYVDFERLYALHQAGAFFVTRAKRNLDARRLYSAPTDRSTGVLCDQTIALNGFFLQPEGLSGTPAPHPLQRSGDPQDPHLSHQSDAAAGARHRRALQEPLASRAVLRVDQAASSDQAVLWKLGQCDENPGLDAGASNPARHTRSGAFFQIKGRQLPRAVPPSRKTQPVLDIF